jgi:DHA2 family multidrug resistance protein
MAMWKHAHFTTESGMPDFFWPLILRGAGLGMIFVPLTALAMADLPMAKIPSATGLFNLTRQLGGSVGIALSATLVPRFAAERRAILAEDISLFNDVARERLATLGGGFAAQGAPPALAQAKALAIVNATVTKQAMMLSFEHIFLLFGFSFVLALPLLLFMRHRAGRSPSGAAAH